MNTTNILRSPRVLTLAAVTLIGAAATFTGTNNAFATEDINIGVGELQECTISKSMDSASPKLTQYAINGNSPAATLNYTKIEFRNLSMSEGKE